VLARELFFTPALIARLLGVLERLPRIAMLPSGPPVAAAVLAPAVLLARTCRLRPLRVGAPSR
jgi:hypothetical protein